jgi:hypothetical protein
MAKAAGNIRIDFSKEEEVGGGRVHWPEGDYHVKIKSAKATRSSEKDTPGIQVTFVVLDGKKKGKTISDTLWITPKSLSRVRRLLEAVGVKVPKSAINLPLGKLAGKSLWIELQDEERDGYETRSRVAFDGFTSEDDYEEDDDAEDEDLEDDEDEDDDEDDDEEEDEDDDDDDDEEEPAPRKKRAAKKPVKKTKKKTDDDEDDDIEDLDLDDL